MGRLDRLEENMEKLVTSLQTTDKCNAALNTTFCLNHRRTNPTTAEPTFHPMQETKSSKDEFYHLYGLLKNNKNIFNNLILDSRNITWTPSKTHEPD